MTALKNVPAIGLVPVATSIPATLCHHLNADERGRCLLAPHARTTDHSGYVVETDTTRTWKTA